MRSGKIPHILGPGVAVDRGKVDTVVAAGGIAPSLLQQCVEPVPTGRVGDVAGDHLVVDNNAAVAAAKAEQLPLDAVAQRPPRAPRPAPDRPSPPYL